MFAIFTRRRLILPIAPSLGGAIGLLVAIAIALIPDATLGRLVAASGLSAILSPAAPPLGALARALLVVVGGGLAALLASAGIYAVLGRRALSIGRAAIATSDARAETVPVLRRADAHPDAPARRPVFAARDLGTPLLDVTVENVSVEPELALPADLDQPLAAFDPGAIPPVPRAPIRPVAALARLPRPQLIDPGDRFETFALPVQPDMAADKADAPPEPTATIHALLDRLERGFSRAERTPPASIHPIDGLQDALGTLRRLAAGGGVGIR